MKSNSLNSTVVVHLGIKITTVSRDIAVSLPEKPVNKAVTVVTCALEFDSVESLVALQEGHLAKIALILQLISHLAVAMSAPLIGEFAILKAFFLICKFTENSCYSL